MKSYLKHEHGRTGINIIWIVVNVLLYTGTSVLLTFTTNAIFSRDMRALLVWSAINFSVWGAFLISNYFQVVFQEKLTQRIMVDIRDTISRKIVGSSYAQYHNKTTGEYLSEYVNDVGNIESNAIKKFFTLLSDGTTVVFSTIALAAYHLLFIPAILLLSVLMLRVPSRLSRPMTSATKTMSKGNAAFSNQVTNVLNGFDVLFNANKLGKLHDLIKSAAKKYAAVKVAYTKTNARVSNLIAALSIFCQVMVDIMTSILAILGAIPLGAISSTGSIAANIFNSLSSLSNDTVQIKATYPLFDKVSAGASKKLPSAEKTPVPVFHHALRVVDLSYAIDGKQILNHLNLTFERGGKYAIIGRSGVGKSTLLKILDGQITDYTGHVYIDNKDLRAMSMAELTKVSQYVDQNVYLFNDSVANNTSLWENQSRSKHRLQEAFSKAKVDFVEFPGQIIQENGQNLSGGQKQRLALARFFYAPKPIAFVDEGTSALDAKTARLVTEEFLKDPDMTLIEVSHHLDHELRGAYDQVIDLGA
ncbi:ABC transporter ATP-binding protein/permease [Lacticaseibacillus casei]|jgi:ATP-binding cassette subfamily B protein/ATP-binding cassette subfamily C protein|uniref:ABC transporter ATP-binding protein n=1 Tax=Lacticaseibacillus huelsenbergensis TaxID=3035291 RepID=A0ABY8DNP6_9LACO|nr:MULTISPECIES: ABC transporter ATP-binding protein [Lacticaseibacillus]MDG3061313.1 ABC transporter ATP-binding protein [Lacticaseibacillus sp. BCRC 81376]QVI38662.1 ABC transporter ATP-binding protein [Lacticaseibacillus casei]QXG60389.1 ABC transporter ATP-binding protein/permease [Lacticaseibacillus casei]WFB38057.1 ABC transporter ATP-binding protein [Lacticaseibacillus huelsenbergensis]WFB42460.1 ABC transporter ATP-binding protein [Lacticaseibacillus huelsenbergensis]